MEQILWGASAVVILLGAWLAYIKTRDPFHPAVILAPSLAFVYGFWPFSLNYNQGLQELLGSSNLVFVGSIYLFALLAFYAGLLRFPPSSALKRLRQIRLYANNPFNLNLPKTARRRLFAVSIVLGFLGLLAYINIITNVGGLVSAYSQAKGGGVAGSGYVGEGVLLSFPAILLLGLSRQGLGRLRLTDISLALFIATPHLLQGLLGGRRGPLFLVLAVLFLARFFARGKLPSLGASLAGFISIGFIILLVASQRQDLYLGSGGEFSMARLFDLFITPEDLETNDYVAGASSVIINNYTKDFTWGRDHLVNLLIRPIPRQLWPSKYEDAANIFGYRVVEGGGDWEHFADVLGFAPPKGSAVGFLSDLYGNFSFGVFLAVFFLGWFLAVLWSRHRLRGGVWSVVFAEAMILSVYLPTQSFSAFYQRLLIMSAITILVFKFYVKPGSQRTIARSPQ
jgi:hypothetical protein